MASHLLQRQNWWIYQASGCCAICPLHSSSINHSRLLSWVHLLSLTRPMEQQGGEWGSIRQDQWYTFATFDQGGLMHVKSPEIRDESSLLLFVSSVQWVLWGEMLHSVHFAVRVNLLLNSPKPRTRIIYIFVGKFGFVESFSLYHSFPRQKFMSKCIHKFKLNAWIVS